jgi:hypothetical protein
VPVLILEVVRVMRFGVWRPVADRVVNVGEDVEGVEAGAGRRGVHRGEHPVEASIAQQGSGPG